MLKKRFIGVLTVLLSLCVLLSVCCVSAKTEYTLTDAASKRRLSIYMKYDKVEPVGGVTEGKLYVTGVDKAEAMKLYDGKTETTPECDEEMTVTLDMGVNIMFSQIRYYAGKIENNNCLGTRFYASKDNRNFNELAVVEGTTPPENGWNEVSFSGFGEYRYFRMVAPPNSNISEVEWMGTSGYKKEGKSVKLNLCGYNEGKELPTTVLACVFNKDGIMKSGQIYNQILEEKTKLNLK